MPTSVENEEATILTSVKLTLGVHESYEAFDQQILMHINSVFTILNQLGIGPKSLFVATATSKWSDFLSGDSINLELVKSYVYLKTRQLFDPPSNSFLNDAIEKQVKEYEWRLNVFVDSYLEETEDGI